MTDPRNPHALALVRAAVEASSINAVAAEIDYSRPAVSRYLSGDYPSLGPIEAAIVSRYDRRHCPHIDEEVAPEYCIRRALAPQPFGGNARLAHWQACQRCEHKPISPKEDRS